MDKITVMIIDKQSFFRAGLRQALSQHTEFEILDADETQETPEQIETSSPDVVLLGIDLAAVSGLELGKKITRHHPNIRLIVLSSDPNDEELFEVIKTGAVAYLSKNTTSENLADTIRQASSGQYPINDSLTARPRVAEHVLKQFQSITAMGKMMEGVAAPLTQRETQILSYVAEGNSNKQIARLLEISEQTIKNHVSSILRKLNANDRAHAVALAMRSGWISAGKTNEL